MKKKNIGFILFGVAGGEFLSGLIYYLVYTQIYERMGAPQIQIRMLFLVLIISTITAIVLVIVGIILLIKYRRE